MNVFKIEDMKGGWFVGNFEPTVLATNFEVGHKKITKGYQYRPHYHQYVTEINYLLKGKMIFNGTEINAGEIFVVEPYTVAEETFLEDCELIVVKTPSRNDKVEYEKL